MQLRSTCLGIVTVVVLGVLVSQSAAAADKIRDLQTKAVEMDRADFGHWGIDPARYTLWGTHSNRLIPVYTYGTRDAGPNLDLKSYMGDHSLYRQADAVQRLYGRVPPLTVSATATYLDQTNIYDLQKAAVAAGKKHIFLVIFDGMDWVTTQAAAIHATQKVAYTSGRGTGLHWLDYAANGTTQFGFMVTSPHNEGTLVDANTQTVKNPGGKIFGGYDPTRGGFTPWDVPPFLPYLISLPENDPARHAYTDSSSSASSMTAGIKTFNGGVNVDYAGGRVETIAHQLQGQGWLVGVTTSVPISHATPAAAYAHNVERDDYQDLTRDMLGLKSISHPQQPLTGLDVVIGTGFGSTFDLMKAADEKKAAEHTVLAGTNFVPGNLYLTVADQQAADVNHGGKYVVATRAAGVSGSERLQQAAEQAAAHKRRLLGFYGVPKTGHLPFATADGDFQPTIGRKKTAEAYNEADLTENPSLAQMTHSAITALHRPNQKFWLMVEAGDVDWANHDDNIDNSIGAVKSGDAAVKVITDWVEQNSNWNESLLIVTADHGHLLVLENPELLAK